MAIEWPTILAMLSFPAIVGREKPTHLQLVPPSAPIQAPTVSTQKPSVSRQKTVAKPAPALLPKEALTIFVAYMVREFAGNVFTFPQMAEFYAAEAKINGWPSVSPKALSQALTAQRCTVEPGKRDKDGRRLKVVTLAKSKSKPRAARNRA